MPKELVVPNRREPVEPEGDALTVRLLRAYKHCTQSHLAQATGDALAQLDRVAPFIADQPEPRLLWVYHYNSGVCLCRLARYAEAVREVAEARDLAVSLRNDLDLARVLWLEGQVLAGSGHGRTRPPPARLPRTRTL